VFVRLLHQNPKHPSDGLFPLSTASKVLSTQPLQERRFTISQKFSKFSKLLND
jgi:hypothetical protein